MPRLARTAAGRSWPLPDRESCSDSPRSGRLEQQDRPCGRPRKARKLREDDEDIGAGRNECALHDVGSPRRRAGVNFATAVSASLCSLAEIDAPRLQAEFAGAMRHRPFDRMPAPRHNLAETLSASDCRFREISIDHARNRRAVAEIFRHEPRPDRRRGMVDQPQEMLPRKISARADQYGELVVTDRAFEQHAETRVGDARGGILGNGVRRPAHRLA